MTERKKPGPKPKCKECGRKEGEGHYDDCPVGMGVIHRVEPDANPPISDKAAIAAQAYALRIWSKQSSDLSRHERLGRIAEALKAQGLSMEGVELP